METEIESQPTDHEVEPRNWVAKIPRKLKQNLSFQSKLGEINGAMGDLGTYIPIVLTLTLARDLNLGTTLLFTGSYNVVIGALFGLPMPTQPMKIISAVALSNPSFGIPEIMAAGICNSAILFFLGLTGLMDVVYRLVPTSVTRGIQLSQGLNFALTAVKYVQKKQDFSAAKTVGPRPWIGLDGVILAVVVAVFIIVVNGAGEDRKEGEEGLEGNRVFLHKARKVFFSAPSALLVFLFGLALAIVRGPPKSLAKGFEFGPSKFGIVRISRDAWRDGFIKGTIPQLPLTIMNSIIAVVKLSSDLFPERKELSATSVAMSIGVMNVVGCWFGAVPSCLGAGGLAAQYKYGGRSGGCVAFLGGVNIVIGVVFGRSIVRVLERFPVAILGILLLFAGIELAMAARDMNTKEEVFVMLICTAVSLGVSSGAAFGFLCGIVVHLLLTLRYYDKVDWNPRLWLRTRT